MLFSVNAKNMVEKVSIFNFIHAKHSEPITEHLLITLKDSFLLIEGTDFESRIKASIAIVILEEGEDSVCIPYRQFSDSLRAIGDKDVKISINKNTLKTVIRHETGEIRMECLPADDFPVIKETEYVRAGSIDSVSIIDAISRVSRFAYPDSFRAQIAGVFIDAQAGRINFVATDLNRLAVSTKDSDIIMPFSCILSTKSVNALRQYLSKARIDSIDLYWDNSVLRIKAGSEDMFMRSIEQKYPNYKSIIPESGDELVIERQSFIEALNRVGVCSGDDNNIKLTISPNEMKLFSFGNTSKAIDSVPVECDFSVEVYAKIDALLSTVSVLDDEYVHMIFNGSNKAILLKGLGTICLVMPTQKVF